MVLNPLNKFNKLKRFSTFVSDTLREKVEAELPRVDCLYRGDIYTRRDMWEKIDAIADCASLVELRKYDTGEIVVHNANWCHNPVVCPMCADRVSKRRRAIFSEPIRRAVQRFGVDETCGDWKKEYPKEYTGVYLGTATMENGPELKKRIDLIQKSVRRMVRKGQRRKNRRGRGEWSKVTAAIGNTECKIGSGSNAWHVHVHFLIFTSEPIDIRIRAGEYEIERKKENRKISVSKWNYEWYQSTGGSGVNFDLKPIRYRRWVNGIECETFEESVRAQAQEVLKYTAVLSAKKGLSILDAARYIELIQRRGNRRLFNAYGLLRCDKRNPDSFITVSERELRRLEYVEEMDKKCYEIYSSKWQKGGAYSDLTKQEGALFSNSDDMKTRYINLRRKAFLAQTAKYQGEYRRERHALFKTRFMHFDKDVFENLLNECRDIFRSRVSALWGNFADLNFLPEFLCQFDSGGLMEYRRKSLVFTW
jgi:hypothetical protein